MTDVETSQDRLTELETKVIAIHDLLSRMIVVQAVTDCTVNSTQETLTEILTKVDTVVEQIAPLVKQVEESPVFRMLGGSSDRKERRERRRSRDSVVSS